MLLKQSLITAAQPDLDILSPQNIAGSPRLCPPASGRGLLVPINIAAVVSGLLLLSRKPLTGQTSTEKYIYKNLIIFITSLRKFQRRQEMNLSIQLILVLLTITQIVNGISLG